MKYLKTKAAFIVMLLLLAACGGDDSDNDIGSNTDIQGKTYRMSVSLPAQGAETNVVLEGLTKTISSISGNAEWLTVAKNSSGSTLSVKLTAEDNPNKETRSCVVTIVDSSNNHLLLSVTQEEAPPSPKTYQQGITLPAKEAEVNFVLEGLTKTISSITKNAEWLTVKDNSSWSTLSVKLTATDNPNKESRSCVVTIVDSSNNRLLLNVTQEGATSLTYQQSVTLPAKEAEANVVLEGLKTKIVSSKGAASWLTISTSYKNGSVSARLKAEDNSKEEERSCTVTFVAESGDILQLKVIQEKYESPSNTGIDDSHDIPTDQPAYSRSR